MKGKTIGGLVALLVLALCVLHHDVWWWDLPRPVTPATPPEHRLDGIVFGFLPIGLAWHVGLSLGAGVVWFLAVTFCWPRSLDEQEAGR